MLTFDKITDKTSDGIQGVRSGLRGPVHGISARLANLLLN